MYTTSYPIIVEFNSVKKRNEYSNYTLSLGYWDGSALSYDLLYNGKTFWDGNGNTKIEISRLLRNFQEDFAPVYNTTLQKYLPEGYGVFSITTDTLYPLEQSGSLRFGNGIFKIEPDDETAQYIYASEMANPFYSGVTNVKPYEMFDTSVQGMQLQNYNRLYHCVNHIPLVKSDYAMFGWFFGRNKGMMDLSGAAKTMIRAKNHHTAFDLNVTYFGDYQGACRATDLYTGLSLYYEDDLYLTTPYNVSTQYDDKYHVAHVDECPRDFYVNWWDSCGWHCLGFDGTVEIEADKDNKDIINNLGIGFNYSTAGKAKFTLNSGYVDEDVVATIMTLKNAKWIFVYDNRNDKGQYCTLNSMSGDILKTKLGKKPQNVQVKLDEAIMFKS